MSVNTKSYKDHYRRLLYNGVDTKLFFEELSKHVSIGNGEKVTLLLDILKKERKLKLLANYRANEGESILHVAAKFNQSSEIIETLIKTCPELMTTARRESEEYHGQTALHIAIAKGNVDAVETMLSEILNLSQNLKNALLHQLATGFKFVNTVMMGELPLSVAALTFNQEMIVALLQNGAELERRNTKGDTVFHTLIRYAAIYPEHVPNILVTMNFLYSQSTEQIGNLGKDAPFLSMEYDHNDYSYIWFIPNNDDLNALQLAATLSQAEMFDLIMNLPKVYSFLNNHDGLFDRKLIDITDIDTVTIEKWSKQQQIKETRMQRHTAPTDADGISRHKFMNKTTSCSPFDLCKRETRKSILEIMFDIKSDAAFDFIQLHTVRQIIKTKWLFYRRFYYGWMLFHLAFMIVLTVYSVLRADDIVPSAGTNQTTVTPETRPHHRNTFLDVYRYLYLVVGVLYFFQEVFHLLFRVKAWDLVQLLNVLHNGSYRIILLLFSLSLVIDFILCQSLSSYENYSLVIALITGWWFTIFFLRAQKKFSFFTVMIQKVIFGDMLRFSIIISLALISFTAGIYMAFKGAALSDDEAEDLGSYGATMLLLFQLMLGLGDIEALYKARQPWMAVTLFVVFVLLTYVLMFNALIAMMSQTCTLVSQNRNVQWRVQQLSIITFFEGIFPSCMQKMVGTEKFIKRYNPSLKQVIEEKRYFLDVSSLHIEYANAEDIYSVKRKLQTTYFRDHMNFSPYPHFDLTMQTPRPAYTYFNPQNYLHRDGNQSFRGTDIVITPAPIQSPTSYKDGSPVIQRNKPDPERNPSGSSPNRKEYQSDGEKPNSGQRKSKKKPKKKRIEPEGDNNMSFDDNNPDVSHFHLNYGDLDHLDIPERFPKSHAQMIKPQLMRQESRRRYHSENSLIDTHIENQHQQVLSNTHIGGVPLQYEVNNVYGGGAQVQQPVVPMQQPVAALQQPIRNVQMAAQQIQQPQQPIRRVQMSVPHVSSIANQNQGQGALDIGVIADSYM